MICTIGTFIVIIASQLSQEIKKKLRHTMNIRKDYLKVAKVIPSVFPLVVHLFVELIKDRLLTENSIPVEVGCTGQFWLCGGIVKN